MNTSAQKHHFQTYNLMNDWGLESIYHLANAREGELLLASKNEVFAFDGNEVNQLEAIPTPPFSEIQGVKENPDGKLYLIINDQLYLQGENTPLFEERILCFELKEDQIFFGTEKGLKIYNLKNNMITRPDALASLKSVEIHDLILVSNSIWMASSSGLMEYRTGSNELHGISQSNDINLRRLKNANRTIWSYANNGTIVSYSLKNKKFNTFLNPNYSFNGICVDSSQQVWFGTVDQGILKYQSKKDLWQVLNKDQGLTENRIIDIHTDQWGKVWIITADGVISKYIDRDFELFSITNGLPSNIIDAIDYHNGKLMVSSGGQGIYQFANKNFRKVLDLNTRANDLLIDTTGIWIGTNGSGIIRYNSSETTFIRKEAGLASNWITRITKDDLNQIWLATPSSGLSVIAYKTDMPNNISISKQTIELEDSYISALLAHSSGALYYGTRSGKLGRINGQEQALIPLEIKRPSEIVSIIEGKNQKIYVAFRNSGVYQFATTQYAPKKLSQLPDKVLALEMHKGELYVVNEKGLHTENNAFSTIDGFPSKQAIQDGMVSDGRTLWIGTKDGVINISSLDNVQNPIKPIIHFDDVQIDYESLDNHDQIANIKLGYNVDNIGFHYKGINIHAQEDLDYSFLLEGKDKEWSPWRKNDNISFNNLSTGNYTFKIKARSGEAISDTIQKRFYITAPIWKRWWFFPLLILILGTLGYLIFRNRLRSIKLKNDEEKAKLELKNRLLELEQKANQLQMNPHFIFNALNSIQATVAKENFIEARKEISDFASLMRSILSNSKVKEITLANEIELLENYIAIEKKCRSLNFATSVNLDKDIDPEEINLPPMLIQPFVENAIVHGLSKSAEGKLELNISKLSENILKAEIIDNGIGYDNGQRLKQNKKHKSVAISVTTERIENILNKKYWPGVQIRQISEEGGTIAEVRIPITYNF